MSNNTADLIKTIGGYILAAAIGAGIAYGTTETTASAIGGAATFTLLWAIISH